MKTQKIVVISFDHWNYDGLIVQKLIELGHEAHHIKIGNFKHKNLLERIRNTFSKIFLRKNPKHIKRQDYIIETLKKLGIQDQILVINPELIDLNYHLKIKEFSTRYISYLYDSVARCNVLHLLDGVFNEIYSFDKNDILKYGFQPTQNYNYIEKNNFQAKSIEQEIIYIASIDERLKQMFEIANYLIQEKITFKFVIVGKKAWKYQFKKILFRFVKPNHLITNAQINFTRQRINQQQMLDWYQKSNVLLDLVRKNQTGLSFRIFEAMALGKKIMTSNQSLKDYDFFNEKNYYILENNYKKIKDFVFTPYLEIDQKVYKQYTLESWVKNMFKVE